MCVCVCARARAHALVSVCKYACMRVCMYARTYVRVCSRARQQIGEKTLNLVFRYIKNGKLKVNPVEVVIGREKELV